MAEPPQLRERAFLCTGALLFAASAGGTIYWCRSMSGGMAMPGAWTMSMAWMKMPGQTWLGAGAAFMGMWVVMMVAMMLPSLVPMLSRYRRAVRGRETARLGGLTALVAAGYFCVWSAFGAAAYPLGAVLAAAEMSWPALARSVPVATGVVVLLAGCLQLTPWKVRQLERCRDSPACMPESAVSGWPEAWRHGLRLGVHCGLCCSGFMIVLLVIGVMDLGVMAAVATAIAVERLAPGPERTARVAGLAVMAAGALVIARALSV